MPLVTSRNTTDPVRACASITHSSNGRFETLEPRVGAARNDAEDADVQGKPVVFLSNQPGPMVLENGPCQYLHVVEVPADDPALGEVSWIAEGTGGDLRWFHLSRSVSVQELWEWDERAEAYRSPAARIAEAAFLRWKSRNDVHGLDVDDWLESERAIDHPAIRAEYAWLLRVLGMAPVTLDIYFLLPDSDATTHHGTPMGEPDPGFSPSLRRIWLPIAVGDKEPLTAPPLPRVWNKAADEWQIWRINLWHETIHQLSHHMGVYDPHEPGRSRTSGRPGTKGHGAGWWVAIERAANNLRGVSPDELDALLDR